MEIAYVEPMVLAGYEPKLSEEFQIPAGTIAVIPHDPRRWETPVTDIEAVEALNLDPLPEFTVLCAGQELSRKLYPALAQHYTESGGFYNFTVPNLRKKFIIGIDQDTALPVWGDGIVYFENLPVQEKHPGDVRETL